MPKLKQFLLDHFQPYLMYIIMTYILEDPPKTPLGAWRPPLKI